MGEGQHGECVHDRFQHLKPLTLDQNKHKKFRRTLEACTKYLWGHYYTIPVFHRHYPGKEIIIKI